MTEISNYITEETPICFECKRCKYAVCLGNDCYLVTCKTGYGGVIYTRKSMLCCKFKHKILIKKGRKNDTTTRNT